MAEEQALVQLMDTLDGLELTKSEYEWLEQRFAAMTEKPHCGTSPVAAPSRGARFPRNML